MTFYGKQPFSSTFYKKSKINEDLQFQMNRKIIAPLCYNHQSGANFIIIYRADERKSNFSISFQIHARFLKVTKFGKTLGFPINGWELPRQIRLYWINCFWQKIPIINESTCNFFARKTLAICLISQVLKLRLILIKNQSLGNQFFMMNRAPCKNQNLWLSVTFSGILRLF